MYNYYHWFPTSLVVFMAPTKPLVSQQIEACHSIVGIPEKDTAHLFGAVTPERREEFWRLKRVMFCTPQTLDNDLRSHICNPARIVCVVFDEAHRATGNYAYCSVVKYMELVGQQYRILALTATPGNDTKAIQKVIYNLKIAAIEVRAEDDEDVAQYTNLKQIEIIKCKKSVAGSSSDFARVRGMFENVLRPLVEHLCSHGCLYSDRIDSLTEFVVREAERCVLFLFPSEIIVFKLFVISTLQDMVAQQRVPVVSARSLGVVLHTVGCFTRWRQKLLTSQSGSGGNGSITGAIKGLLEYMNSMTASSLSTSSEEAGIQVTYRIAILAQVFFLFT